MPDAPSEFRYKRVLLKVSGEVLMGDQAYGIDMKTVDVVAAAVAQVAREGVEMLVGRGTVDMKGAWPSSTEKSPSLPGTVTI